jgi:flagellar basal body-associated protein FliL
MASPDQPKGEEIPLEQIDKLLEAEDPEFTKSLEEVRSVEVDRSIEIEASAIDESLSEDDGFEDESEKGWRKLRSKLKAKWQAAKIRVKNRLIQSLKNALMFFKTRPKEFLFYALKMAKIGAKKSLVPLIAFKNADRSRKLTVLLLAAMAVASAWVLLANFRGIWLPHLNEPILRQFTPYAKFVESYDPKDGGESFYTAFPQKRYEFLFHKMKLNLTAGPENPLPMGAFEVMVLLDSKDTAIEVRDREIEFYDMLSRVIEGFTFPELASEAGKARLKSAIKREMNQNLTQGWVKEIDFKTFILKP